MVESVSRACSTVLDSVPPDGTFDFLSAGGAGEEPHGFGHVYVDGGRTIQAFPRAGFIQRLVISRVPILIGEGIPLFGPLDADVLLTHVATRTFAGGLVQSESEVVRSPGANAVG